MAEFYTLESETLTAIADAIRQKRDITDEITPLDMPMQIGLIDGLPLNIEKFASGYIDSENVTPTTINIPHNFNALPDIIFIKQNTSLKDCKAGTCYMCIYYRIPDSGVTGNVKTDSYSFMYAYKHVTSKNILISTYNNGSAYTNLNVYGAVRGDSDWAKVDDNGLPINYIWIAIKFNDE